MWLPWSVPGPGRVPGAGLAGKSLAEHEAQMRMPRRLDALIAADVDAADARRLLKRLRRTGDHLFTFLDYPQIPFENNFAERQIR
ncbi:MAG: transposase, partial [Planctomycetes bacterium]|nr:transposase [Planctomycetota bacterium]